MQDGKIFLNNTLVSDFSCEVKDGDVLMIDDQEYTISLRTTEKKLIVFHKPVGYVVSRDDPHNKTIYDLLPAAFAQYRYIGRLDKDSRGLLLLSNDLDLVHRLAHPSYAWEKIYDVKLDRVLDSDAMQAALQWVRDGDDILHAVGIELLDDARYRVTLQEGKNRHIRRMFAALWYEVLDLCRIAHGEYRLDDLEEGGYRIINDKL